MNQPVFDAIAATITTILAERNESAPELGLQTPLSASGLDSLDIAALVVRLEEQMGIDPFSQALSRYPRTLGELADLYACSRHPRPEEGRVDSDA